MADTWEILSYMFIITNKYTCRFKLYDLIATEPISKMKQHQEFSFSALLARYYLLESRFD